MGIQAMTSGANERDRGWPASERLSFDEPGAFDPIRRAAGSNRSKTGSHRCRSVCGDRWNAPASESSLANLRRRPSDGRFRSGTERHLAPPAQSRVEII